METSGDGAGGKSHRGSDDGSQQSSRKGRKVGFVDPRYDKPWKGKGKDRPGSSKGKRSKGPDRLDQLTDTVAKLSEAVAQMAISSSSGSKTASASSSSKQKSEPNPDKQSYANAKRSLQKKRSTLLRLFGVSAGSDFCWEEAFPNTEETRDRIAKVRTENSETFARLVKGIRSAEKKVSSRKHDPANASEQPLQVLPSVFDKTDAEDSEREDNAAAG